VRLVTAPGLRQARAPATSTDRADRQPGFERWPIAIIAIGFVLLELAVSARYGIHRDELYFLACAHHLAWGYVDQPPFVPFVAWLANVVVGPSAVALRFLPALAGGATVVVTALMARQLGGGRTAQVIAALAAATSPVLMSTFHLLSTSAFDTFFWSVLVLIALRILGTGDQRLWVLYGAIGGIGLLNKLNIGFLAVVLVLCIAFSRQRQLLWTPYAMGGAALAAALFLPDLIWNASHDWAQVAMLRTLHQENSGLGVSLSFVPDEVLVVGPVLAFLWIGGLVRLLRDRVGRPIAVTYLILLAWFVLSGAKPYYLAGMYPALFAAGGVFAQDRILARHKSGRLRGWVALMLAGAVLALPLALPVLPASTLPQGAWEGQINKDLSATVGWQTLVAQVAEIAEHLPAQERSHLVIFTGDYGAAGAIDRYGNQYRLPTAISGHNNYWWWGPGDAPDHSTTIAINLSRSYLKTIFSRVIRVGSVRTPRNIWTEERGDPIFLCSGQIESWALAWPNARHYG
jgi:4-amino-4-deoxy-L-arabinose transferase-like glycosyltransferase